MDALASWLETHKERLISLSVEQLSLRELLRKESEGPVRWFFDRLIRTVVEGQDDRLESLLRGWVALSRVPINGHVVGLLPVLGVFKKAIWQQFQAQPPAESPLELAIRLDGVISSAAEYLSKVEAATLMEAATHQLARIPSPGGNDHAQHRFISIAAHELKTPLTVIEGYAHMLRLELETQEPTRAVSMIKGLEVGITRLRGLINDLIDVSLIDSNLLRLELQPVWLRRVVDIAVSDVREPAAQRNLLVEVLQDTIPQRATIGDPDALLKAVHKVLANAIKYTPDGGKIVVSAQLRAGFVDLIIEDTGIGIAPENLDHIFEKFSTLGDLTHHSSSKSKFKGGGPGLGLPIAKGILEAHGGSIWAESSGCNEEQRPGCRFHLMIPLRDVVSGEGMTALVALAASTLGSHAPAAVASAPLPAAAPGPEKEHVVQPAAAAAAGESQPPQVIEPPAPVPQATDGAN